MARKIVEIGIGNQIVQNDFDNLPIYKEMRRVTDDYGNIFVRIPKFYIRKINSQGKLSVNISKTELQGGYLPKVFWDFDKNVELPYVDVGAYLASLSSNGQRLESKPGVKPLASRTISQFRDLARANGAGYQQLDIHAVDILRELFFNEFGTLNGQSVHPGYTGGAEAIDTGGTDGVVASSGAAGSSNLYQFMYRGIEDLWGHVWQFVDGVNILDNQAYVADNANQYASDVFVAPYKKLSYKNATANGYVKDMGFDPNNPSAMFPIAVAGGANSTTYYADNYYQDDGQRIARFGGAWLGALAGPSYWSLPAASSDSSAAVGGRLLRKPL